jgi:hypothetical protein
MYVGTGVVAVLVGIGIGRVVRARPVVTAAAGARPPAPAPAPPQVIPVEKESPVVDAGPAAPADVALILLAPVAAARRPVDAGARATVSTALVARDDQDRHDDAWPPPPVIVDAGALPPAPVVDAGPPLVDAGPRRALEEEEDVALPRSSVSIAFTDQLSSWLKRTSLDLYVDGKRVFSAQGDEPLEQRRDLSLFPGTHQVRVEATYVGKGGLFSYMEAYRFKLREMLVVDVEDGKAKRIVATTFDRGPMEPWEKRPAMKLEAR